MTLHDDRGRVLAPRRRPTRPASPDCPTIAPSPAGRRGCGGARLVELPGIRHRGAGRRPGGARHQRLRPRPEPLALQRLRRPGAALACRRRSRSSPSAASIARASRSTPRPSSATGPLGALTPARGRATRSAGSSRIARTRAVRSAPCATRSWRSRSFGTAEQRFDDSRRRGARRLPDRGPAAPRRTLDRARVRPGTGSRSTGRRSSWWMSPPTAGRASRATRSARAVEARYLFGAPMGARRGTLDAAPQSRRLMGPRHPRHRGLPHHRRGLVVRGARRAAAGVQRAVERPRHARSRPVGWRCGCKSGGHRARPSVAGDGRGHRHRRQSPDGLGLGERVVVHPAAFYLGSEAGRATSYFWTAGTPATVGVIAVRPDGDAGRGRVGAGHGRAARVAPGTPRARGLRRAGR